MSDLIDLRETLARVAVSDRDLGDTLSEIAGVARRAVTAFDAASITLIRGDKAFTAGYNGQIALPPTICNTTTGTAPVSRLAGRANQ
jgi:hypothetical protein